MPLPAANSNDHRPKRVLKNYSKGVGNSVENILQLEEEQLLKNNKSKSVMSKIKSNSRPNTASRKRKQDTSVHEDQVKSKAKKTKQNCKDKNEVKVQPKGKGKGKCKAKVKPKSVTENNTTDAEKANKDNYCGYCQGYYYDECSDDEDWINCNSCKSWFHHSCSGTRVKNMSVSLCRYCRDK